MGYVENAREQHIRGIRQGLHRIVGPDSYVSPWAMRPVILDVENQSWAEDASLVAEVNRRGYVNTFGDESIIRNLVARLEEGETAVVIADHDSPLCNAPNAYAIRLDQMQPDFDSAGPLELARLLRVGEAPLIAVSGSVGGAGVSTLAFFLADALGAAGMDAVMLDAAPESTGVDVALGVERVEGTRIMGADLNPELKELPQVGFARLLAQAREGCTSIDLPRYLRGLEESAVVVDCGRAIPHEASRWQNYVPDAHVIVCPLTVAGVAAALIYWERALDSGWPDPLFVLRQTAHSSVTLALASVILDTLPTIVIEDDPQLAQDIDSGQLEYYANGYRESPEIVAERAAEIPGARPRSLSAGLRHAWAFTEAALETAERSVERQIARGLGEYRREAEQRVRRCKPVHAARGLVEVIQAQRTRTFLDIESLRLDSIERVA